MLYGKPIISLWTLWLWRSPRCVPQLRGMGWSWTCWIFTIARFECIQKEFYLWYEKMRKRLVIESCVGISADHVRVHARVFSRELLTRKEILGCPSTGREMICITVMTLSSHRNKTELPYAKGAHPAFSVNPCMRTTSLCVMVSDPCLFAYGDPHAICIRPSDWLIDLSLRYH